MTVDDLAEMIHKPKNTIYKHRAMGTGPLAMRVGKSLLVLGLRRPLVAQGPRRRALEADRFEHNGCAGVGDASSEIDVLGYRRPSMPELVGSVAGTQTGLIHRRGD